ncbi:MAG: hypothetical protein KatS3mg060_1530 [Dehalococcoidia bacterium]|nr:MAG: hypothetical protein KatS3mg060_1530 [Dehalococcoidia bacterium]
MTLVNRRRAATVLSRSGIDALVATTPPNVRYLLDWRPPALGREPRPGRHWAILPADPSKPLGVVLAETDLVDLPADRLVGLEVRPGGPGAAPLDEVLDALGLAGGRIALDDPVAALALEADGVYIAQPTGADLFRRVRAVKTADEIERLRAAAEANAVALRAALVVAEPLRPWRDVEDAWRREFASSGAETVVWDSYLADAYNPPSRPLGRHDPIGLLTAGALNGYWSELGRVALVGDILPKPEKYARALAHAFDLVLPTLQPGTAIEDLAPVVARACDEAGLPDQPWPPLRGIGIERAELPAVGVPWENVLEPGNVVVLSFAYREPGWAVLTLAEPVLITATAPRRLSPLSLDLLVTRG